MELGWTLYMLYLGGIQHDDNILATVVGTWYTKSLRIFTNTYGYVYKGCSAKKRIDHIPCLCNVGLPLVTCSCRIVACSAGKYIQKFYVIFSSEIYIFF